MAISTCAHPRKHGWQWLSGTQPHFWDAPFYYPEPNVIAYSDSHLGTLPFYAAFRLIGLDRETAFQGWFLILFAANHLACFWVLRRLGMTWAGSGAGAYVFAFAMAMICQVGHPQLIPRFLVPLAAWFAVMTCRHGLARHWLGLGVCVVWQFYCAIYLGYFLALFLAAFVPVYLGLRWRSDLAAAFGRLGWEGFVAPGVLLLWGFLSLPLQPHRALVLFALASLYLAWRYRQLLWQALCGGSARNFLIRGGIVAACCLSLLPLLLPYLEVSRERGGRPAAEILSMLPRLASWLSPPDSSLVWGRLNANSLDLPAPGEHLIFLGGVPLCMLALALVCSFMSRNSEPRRLAGAAALAFAVLFLVTLFCHKFSLYAPFVSLPGVSAIRVVSRLALVLLFPAALAVAFGFSRLETETRRRLGTGPAFVAITLLLALVVVDQKMDDDDGTGWTKQQCQESVAALVDEVRQSNPNARLFFDIRANASGNEDDKVRQETRAMAASQVLGIPTLNGYSGWSPEGWGDFTCWEHLDYWKFRVVDRVGEGKLRQRVPWFEHGFSDLVVLGDLGKPADPALRRTSTHTALPIEGCRAHLKAVGVPTQMKSAGVYKVALHVTNTGTLTWPCAGTTDGCYRIASAYRWLSAAGRKDLFRSKRQGLLHDMAPGESIVQQVEVKPPSEPGRYLLEFDLVQEAVFWFSQTGTNPLSFPVEVLSEE